MPRRPRVIVPGVAHHVTQRGNNRQSVFFNSDDRLLYLRLLRYHASRNGAHILGYCLMTNHVHLIVTPDRESSLARTFGATHAEYALALNQAANRTGHLWRNRYFSCPLEGAHLERAMLYVDLNPVRADLVASACDWPWSSARVHSTEGLTDPVLDADWVDQAGGWDRADWRARLSSSQTGGEDALLRRATLRGEPLGSTHFVEELEQRAGRRLRVFARGRPRRPALPAAYTLLQESMVANGESDLKKVSDPFFKCV